VRQAHVFSSSYSVAARRSESRVHARVTFTSNLPINSANDGESTWLKGDTDQSKSRSTVFKTRDK